MATAIGMKDPLSDEELEAAETAQEEVNPYTKAATFVLRLAGVGMVLISFVLLAGNLMMHLTQHKVDAPALLILESLPLPLGIVVLWKSTAMARRLTDYLEGE